MAEVFWVNQGHHACIGALQQNLSPALGPRQQKMRQIAVAEVLLSPVVISDRDQGFQLDIRHLEFRVGFIVNP